MTDKPRLFDPEIFKTENDIELVRAVFRWGAETLERTKHCVIDDPKAEARKLLSFVCALPLNGLPLERIEDSAISRYYDVIQRRALGEPFAYIVGTQGFWTLDFNVAPSTLIPRCDSEALIELLLDLRPQKNAPYSILDLGTGTGCLLLSALSEYSQAHGLGIDINADAIRLAESNAVLNGLENRSRWSVGDWASDVTDRFDVIISNPPYITSDDMNYLDKTVAGFEPHRALCGGTDGLDAYRIILSQSRNLLKPSGIGILEIGYDQVASVKDLICEYRFEFAGEKKDLGGIVRALAFSF